MLIAGPDYCGPPKIVVTQIRSHKPSRHPPPLPANVRALNFNAS